MPEITYQDDVTGFLAKMKGSDGRANVSSRSDSRGYYNSRDREQAYSMPYNHTASVANEYSFYLKNTSSSKTLVVSFVGVSSDLGVDVKLWFVTGTAGDGVTVTPVNLNKASSNAADVTALDDGGGTTISSLSTDGIIDYKTIGIGEHEELHVDDRVRLGQNDAIALEVDAVTSGTPQVFGSVFFYFE